MTSTTFRRFPSKIALLAAIPLLLTSSLRSEEQIANPLTQITSAHLRGGISYLSYSEALRLSYDNSYRKPRTQTWLDGAGRIKLTAEQDAAMKNQRKSE